MNLSSLAKAISLFVILSFSGRVLAQRSYINLPYEVRCGP